MTINEAEQRYDLEVAYCIEQHKNELQKQMNVTGIVGAVLIVIGIVLLIIGFTTPPEITSWGYESEPIEAMLEKIFGWISLVCGAFCLVMLPRLYKNQKKGPASFLPSIKNLYLNYLKCEDMDAPYKEFYKQKLEEIRHTELINAINNAATATTASITTAIMFNTLHK